MKRFEPRNKKYISVVRVIYRQSIKRRCIEFWWGNLTERNHLEDLGIDARVILKSSISGKIRDRTGVAQDRAGGGLL